MNNYIPEDKTTAFPCPFCELKDQQRRWARKVDDYFFCKTCGRKYRNRDEANRIRRELQPITDSN